MISQILLNVLVVKMYCIWTDLYHEYIYRKKSGHKLMEILELLLA